MVNDIDTDLSEAVHVGFPSPVVTPFNGIVKQTENRIAVARKRYVEAVAEYNKSVRYFPTNLTAKYLLGLDVRQSFSAEESAAKPPQVKF